ncbi:hypothetical protein WJX81_000726 [Elliptochloris bilobata]|uniref:Polyketide synthase n=1 Tax=Elliptochloris bilobata TaxID=381761 RepID=A0AAW1S6R3_9CHLO
MADLTPSSMWALAAAKAVDAAAPGRAALPLRERLLFSSTASAWSQPGAGHYAAANAALNASADAARAAGVTATAVSFGPFGGVGMAAAHSEGLVALGLHALNAGGVGTAFAESGYAVRPIRTGALESEETGVYVGIQQMEYGGLAARHLPVMSAYTATGQPFSVAAGRVSFSFGFKGPAVSIDTACSSALVATHLAAQHLAGGSGGALAAGTLDATADGYVRAEACIVVYLTADQAARPHASGSTGSSSLAGCDGGTAIVLLASFVNQDALLLRQSAGSFRAALAGKGLVARLLGPGVSSSQPLMEAGLDSIGAVELRALLGARFGSELPATLIFDHSTAAALAAHLTAGLEALPHQALAPRLNLAAALEA